MLPGATIAHIGVAVPDLAAALAFYRDVVGLDVRRLQHREAEQRHDGSKGALKGAGHEVSWDLSWSAAERTHHHLPAILYKGTLGDTKVLSPNPDVALRGRVEVLLKRRTPVAQRQDMLS